MYLFVSFMEESNTGINKLLASSLKYLSKASWSYVIHSSSNVIACGKALYTYLLPGHLMKWPDKHLVT